MHELFLKAHLSSDTIYTTSEFIYITSPKKGETDSSTTNSKMIGPCILLPAHSKQVQYI